MSIIFSLIKSNERQYFSSFPIDLKKIHNKFLGYSDISVIIVSHGGYVPISFISHSILLLVARLVFRMLKIVQRPDIHLCGDLQSCIWCPIPIPISLPPL
jgi:hypothetical protein